MSKLIRMLLNYRMNRQNEQHKSCHGMLHNTGAVVGFVLLFLVSAFLFAGTGQLTFEFKLPSARSNEISATPTLEWVMLPASQNNGSCSSATDCCSGVICFGLQYTPGANGNITSYTTGFFTDCLNGASPVISNLSCIMGDNSHEINGCLMADSILFNSSGFEGMVPVTAGVPVILHQVCFTIDIGDTLIIYEDPVTDLSLSIDLTGGGHITEFPVYNTTELLLLQPVVPADGSETLACTSSINISEVTPPAVLDFCGNVITPSGPSGPLYDPENFMCEGTVTYTWTYTDCQGQMVDWNYIYTIDQLADPMEIDGPVPVDSVIECGLDAEPPSLLPTVVDECGNVIPSPTPQIGGTWDGDCDGTITYTYEYMSCAGDNFVWVYTYTVNCFPLKLYVLLEGSYDPAGDTMRTELNYHHLLPGQDKLLSPSLAVQLGASYTPFGQPYTVMPWNYTGNTGLNFGDPTAPGAPMGVTPYPPDVVDWILVTVRESGMLPAHNIWTCAGWVHKNGEVSFPENCGPLDLDIMEDYYVLIQHRNHLGVLSPDPADMLCGGAIINWDFTAENSFQPPFREGQKEMEPGVWAMFAANGEQTLSIAIINSQDLTAWKTLQNLIGYSTGDYNLDVTANSQDETMWKINQNFTSGIIFY